MKVCLHMLNVNVYCTDALVPLIQVVQIVIYVVVSQGTLPPVRNNDFLPSTTFNIFRISDVSSLTLFPQAATLYYDHPT